MLLLFWTGLTSGSYSQKRCLFNFTMLDLLSVLQVLSAITSMHIMSRINSRTKKKYFLSILNSYTTNGSTMTESMDYVRTELTIITRPVKCKTADHEDRPLNNKLLSTIEIV